MPAAAALGRGAPAKQRKGELGGSFTSALQGIYKSCLCMNITVRRKTEAQRALWRAQVHSQLHRENHCLASDRAHLPGAPPPQDLECSQSSMNSQQLTRQIAKQGEDIQGQVLGIGHPAAHKMC